MADPNDFFTWQSLLTFAGTTTATTAVTNGLTRAWSRLNSATIGLVVAVVFCLITALVDMNSGPTQGQLVWARPFATYFVAIVNGFLVFSSAAGLSAGGAALAGGVRPGQEPERHVTFDPVKRGFWRRWI